MPAIQNTAPSTMRENWAAILGNAEAAPGLVEGKQWSPLGEGSGAGLGPLPEKNEFFA